MSSELNLPEIHSLEFPKSNPETDEDVADELFTRYKYVFVSELGLRGLKSEYHLKRLQTLRKELNLHIKETDWMYEPIDKIIDPSVN